MKVDIDLIEFKKELTDELTKIINTPVCKLRKQGKVRKQVEKIITKTTKTHENKRH